MKLPLAFIILLFAASLVRADYVIVQKVDGGGQSGEMTIKLGKDKMRADVSNEVSVITDMTSGQTTTLMHAQKVYMVINKAALEQMAKMAMLGTTPGATAKAPVASGKTDTINGYKATEYLFDNGRMKASYWMSTDFPNAKAVADAMAKYQKSSMTDVTRMFAPDMSGIPGAPIRTVVEINGQKITTELVSAKEAAVDPSEFQIPNGYNEMKMPAMPGAAGGAGQQ